MQKTTDANYTLELFGQQPVHNEIKKLRNKNFLSDIKEYESELQQRNITLLRFRNEIGQSGREY